MFVLCSFKYDPKILKSILFPSQQPSNKRRRVDNEADEQGMDVDGDPGVDELGGIEDIERTREIVLETSKERFLISPSLTGKSTERDGAAIGDTEKNTNTTRRYTVSRIFAPGETPLNSKSIHGEDKPQSTKSSDSSVESKPPPPTWSTPPAESDRSPNPGLAGKKPDKAGPTVERLKPGSKPVPKNFSTDILFNGRGQEHFQFVEDGIIIDRLEIGKIVVKNWRWMRSGEFRNTLIS